MLFINRLLLVGLLSAGITAATTAHAGNQLFEGSWTVKAFGNERTNGASFPSTIYEGFGIPQGVLCHPGQPRCAFDSTPISSKGAFAPLGGHPDYALFCAKLSTYGGGTTVRPAKGATPTTGKSGNAIPPLYRNPKFFTPAGQPDTVSCTGISRIPATAVWPAGAKGLVQAGRPVTGTWSAVTTGTQKGGFNFAAAPAAGPAGVRTTGVAGSFGGSYPYLYSYTYATLRNDAGVFGPGSGPGSFDITYAKGGADVATISVKQGAAKFGGVMRMLGALTVKVCYYRVGGCMLGENNWRYEAIGASAYTSPMFGAVTEGYQALFTTIYYHTALMQQSTIMVVGSRFPWTTGTVTLKATGRGPHKTIHYARGYDNRNTATPSGKGTVQLVTPVLTHWLGSSPSFDMETGGIGILRIKFVPEPQTWAVLVAGVALLGVGTRMRGR